MVDHERPDLRPNRIASDRPARQSVLALSRGAEDAREEEEDEEERVHREDDG